MGTTASAAREQLEADHGFGFPQLKQHTVQEGDTVDSIAAQYGLAPSQLLRMSSETLAGGCKPGQLLWVIALNPPVRAKVHHARHQVASTGNVTLDVRVWQQQLDCSIKSSSLRHIPQQQQPAVGGSGEGGNTGASNGPVDTPAASGTMPIRVSSCPDLASLREPEVLADVIVVLVHPWGKMGGSAAMLHGLANRIASRGVVAVTFDLRGVRRSTGSATWTGHAEVDDVDAVVKWARKTLGRSRVLLCGESAGAAIAGSCAARLENLLGFVSIGYTFGRAASVVFGRHFDAVLSNTCPGLFVMGTKDVFTSVPQLLAYLKRYKGPSYAWIADNLGHFDIEWPPFEEVLAQIIARFLTHVLEHPAHKAPLAKE
eukprot:m.501109 g.501109  ORF g.501109 m.501109 type:complete len:372 (-) comp62995_c0_seq1:117-1232(-)